MKSCQKMKVILFNRNVGDYMHGTARGKKYDPRKMGCSYGIYTHTKDLTGKLEMFETGLDSDMRPGKDIVTHDPFEWEINKIALGDNNWFWGPIPDDISMESLNPKIKVGWRGPSIDMKDAKNLPKYVVHYGDCTNDYSPWLTGNMLIN